MVLAGVHDEQGVTPQRLQGLVHLLPTQNWHVPIDAASYENGGGVDVLHMPERRDVVPGLAMLPRQAQFSDVIPHVLVVTPQAGEFGRTGAGNSGLEAVGLADDEVGGDSAVRPAAHSKLVRVG